LILFCNKRFAKLAGEPADRLMGSYLKRFVTPFDHENLDNLLTQLTLTKTNVLEVTLINSVYLKLSFRHMPPNYHDKNIIVIATDITELKKKENELLEIHRLLKQHLDQSKGLRIDLINAKIEANSESNKLKDTNKKLVKEITRQKAENEGLKQKVLILTKKQ
jgi:hypothetical protein